MPRYTLHAIPEAWHPALVPIEENLAERLALVAEEVQVYEDRVRAARYELQVLEARHMAKLNERIVLEARLRVHAHDPLHHNEEGR